MIKLNHLFVGVFVASALLFSGCRGAADSNYSLQTTNIVKEDSITDENLHIECFYEVEYPSDMHTPLGNAIAEWISGELSGTYKGDMQDGTDMLDFYSNEYMTQTKEWYYKNNSDYEWMKSFCYYVNFSKEYETENFVTYILQDYEYSNGAHGRQRTIGATFRKSDGHLFSWDMFIKNTTNNDSFNEIIKDGVITQYFKGEDVVSNGVLELKNGEMKLPSKNPYLLKDGVKFSYYPYEIASYVMGEPYCVIPYSKLNNYFTAVFNNMLNFKHHILYDHQSSLYYNRLSHSRYR